MGQDEACLLSCLHRLIAQLSGDNGVSDVVKGLYFQLEPVRTTVPGQFGV
jgi:hypothetical protein